MTATETSCGRLVFDRFASIFNLPFEALPQEHRARVYGVDYAHLQEPDCGEIFVTEHGWPFLEHLLPDHWFENKQYVRRGERLIAGTSAVYHVPTKSAAGRRLDLVAKFSRIAQEVPLYIANTFPGGAPAEVLENARFNYPFREFGLLRELRLGRHGPKNLRILTKRALAIFSPAREYSHWQMGRVKWMFEEHQRELRAAGNSPIELYYGREYIMLFAWVRGYDALEMHQQGLLSEQEVAGLTMRVQAEMKAKGFRVLDAKPRHFILRQRPDGELMRRKGKLVYALVDFELLQRTEEFACREGEVD